MAADGTKDWLLDTASIISAVLLGGILIELMRGKLRHWGSKIHGHHHDGRRAYENEDVKELKARKAKHGVEEEEPESKAA